MSDMDFTGKTVLITGSGRGIGREIALAFASRGASIMVNYPNPSEKTDALHCVEEIQASNAKALLFEADVRSAEAVDQMVQTMIQEWGKIDILINNAGVTKDNLLVKMTEEEWKFVLDINLNGVFTCTKRVVKEMMAKRFGRIISISSIMGLVGNAGQANYAASKAGIIAFMKSVAKEFGSRNITANCIAPGFIETQMTHSLPEEVKKTFLNKVLIKRYGSAADIANAALFLASDLASYMTGQVLVVDGGLIL
jgi:3-oxoacyl-[acyl-carrier protein] reductase